MANDNPLIMSPRGIAKYPWLSKPDTKFHDAGEYKVSLIVPEADAKPFIKQITQIRDEFLKTTKTKKKHALPFSKEEDDQGNETGNVIIKFSVKNKEGWSRQPNLFDAKGDPISPKVVNVGGGSILKVRAVAYCWDVSSLGVGVTLQPKDVQVIDLKAIGGSDESPFEEVEGYVHDSSASTFKDETDHDEATTSDDQDADSDLY